MGEIRKPNMQLILRLAPILLLICAVACKGLPTETATDVTDIADFSAQDVATDLSSAQWVDATVVAAKADGNQQALDSDLGTASSSLDASADLPVKLDSGCDLLKVLLVNLDSNPALVETSVHLQATLSNEDVQVQWSWHFGTKPQNQAEFQVDLSDGHTASLSGVKTAEKVSVCAVATVGSCLYESCQEIEFQKGIKVYLGLYAKAAFPIVDTQTCSPKLQKLGPFCTLWNSRPRQR